MSPNAGDRHTVVVGLWWMYSHAWHGDAGSPKRTSPRNSHIRGKCKPMLTAEDLSWGKLRPGPVMVVTPIACRALSVVSRGLVGPRDLVYFQAWAIRGDWR